MTVSPQHVERLRLRHLRLLEMIEKQGSLRAIGGVLNLTQPAVSQMVKDLERAFGVSLIIRSARGVSLSPAGKIALQRARSGLAAFDHLATELQSEQTRVIRIGTNPAVMFQLLPDAIAQLVAQREPFCVKIKAGMVNDMLAELFAGDLDCYVGRIDWDRLPKKMIEMLSFVPLTVTDLVLACSLNHPLAKKEKLAVGDLDDWSWALPPEDSNNRTAFETAFRNLGLPGPKPVVEIGSDPHALMLMAAKLNLLTCVPRSALDAHPAGATLHRLELKELHLPPIQIGFVTLSHMDNVSDINLLKRTLTASCNQ